MNIWPWGVIPIFEARDSRFEWLNDFGRSLWDVHEVLVLWLLAIGVIAVGFVLIVISRRPFSTAAFSLASDAANVRTVLRFKKRASKAYQALYYGTFVGAPVIPHKQPDSVV